jgi:hypothetical protein
MRSATTLGALLWLVQGCVELPSGDATAEDALVDSGLGLGSSIDGGLRRPPTGAPYLGPQCESADPESSVIIAGDAGAPELVTGSDGGAPRAASAGGPDVEGSAGGAALSSHATPAGRVGQLVISELMSNPAALSDTDGEWIELYNPSPSETVALDGCALDDGSTSKSLAAGARVAPLGFATLARSAKVGFIPTQALSFSFGNSDDSVALICNGVEIDRVRYGAGFPLAAGASMSLAPSALDATANDDPAAWCLGTDADALGERGTPGVANPPCELDDAGVL